MSNVILTIDQGTTSTRAILFDSTPKILSSSQRELTQHYPHPGWVEHDPEEIWNATLSVCREALAKAGLPATAVAAIGITNQRETTLVWDRATGKPIYRAIVWQDRRTTLHCEALRRGGAGPLVTARTGLVLDPYFSGTKIAWLLDHIDGARARAEAGRLAFGTIDSYLVWRLTGGAVHATDATNAARTLLFDIHAQRWDPELTQLLGVPPSMLPAVKDCAADFGVTQPPLFGAAIPIAGVAGDQHAAMIGQASFKPGMVKSTYGTGCFALLNTGPTAITSRNRLLTTLAYRLDGKPAYALEAAIFVAGAAVQWLRDGLGIIDNAAETGSMADRADPEQRVYLVPAFVGLGAPHWDAEARGALYGITRSTGPNEIARAALEAVCYQTRDVLEAMRADWTDAGDTVLRVDGGMVASDWTMQCLADTIDAPVDRPAILETTALGAAWLAGRHAGVWPDKNDFAAQWRLDRRFAPALDAPTREARYAGWKDAVRRTLSAR
jgi:glycerol kinase